MNRFLKSLLLLLVATLSCKSRQVEVPFAMVFPNANSRPTYFTVHNVRQAQSVSTGRGVKIGILDHLFGTTKHRELFAGEANFLGPTEAWRLTDTDEHGYWMALVLREIAPDVSIYALNTAHRDGLVRAKAIAAAVDWAIASRIDVLSYSHAAFSSAERAILDPAVAKAHAAGIVTVFIHYGYGGNVLPGGLDADDEDGRQPDINVLHFDYTVLFPGEYEKAQRGEKTWYRPFLSMSSTAPVVAGVVAMMRGVNPALTPPQVQTILRETARADRFGKTDIPRVLDAAAAVARAQAAAGRSR
jgi:hypothetical protein